MARAALTIVMVGGSGGAAAGCASTTAVDPPEPPRATVTLTLEGLAAEVDAPGHSSVAVTRNGAELRGGDELRGDDALWMHIARGPRDVLTTAETIRTRHPGVRVTHVQARGAHAMEFRLGRRQHHFVAIHARGALRWSCWSDARGRFSATAVSRMQAVCASVRAVPEP